MDPLKALGTDSKVKQGWDDTGNDTYTQTRAAADRFFNYQSNFER
jgi:hypothetical protein